jgi:hypothetical protein
MLYGLLKWVTTKILSMWIACALTTVALPGYVLFYEPFSQSHSYVPMSQRGILRLKAHEYCGYLKTLTKRGLKLIETSIANRNTRTCRQRRDTKRWTRKIFSSRSRPKRKSNILRSLCIILSMHAASGTHDYHLTFDTDYKPIRVDNCTSRSEWTMPRARMTTYMNGGAIQNKSMTSPACRKWPVHCSA